MNLLNYFEFIIENINEFRLYYSDEFRSILQDIKSDAEDDDILNVVNFLIAAENNNKLLDKYTLIDVTDKNNTISLIQSNRIIRKFPELVDGQIDYSKLKDKNSELWKSSLRTNISIGKWTRRIFKEVYKKIGYTDSMFEKFVNAYKSSYDIRKNAIDRLEIVSGEEIRKWYLSDNYKSNKGQLGASCMKQKHKQSFFDIYVKNPQVCQLLILKDDVDNSKIVGRSLLWKLRSGKNYQDRIYTNKDSDIKIFEKWAENKNYEYYNGSIKIDDLSVKVLDIEYKRYPYMDTFCVYNPDTSILKADEELWPGQGYILLQDTNGGYRSSDVVYSEYHQEYIDLELAVECNTISGEVDWLYRDSAVYLDYKDEWWAPDDTYIVWSDYHSKYFLLDDVVYSERTQDYLWPESEDVISILINSYGDYDDVPKSRKDLYIEIDGSYYDRNSYIKDPFTGEYEFTDRMIDGKTYHKRLSDKLSKDLGIETIDDKKRVVNELINKFKKGDYPDIKEYISNNEFFNNKIRNVYWGLDPDFKPTLDDMVCLLFAAIIGSTGLYFSGYISKFDEDVSEKYNEWTRKPRLTRNISKFINSFDYSLLGEDIYKVRIWFSL